MEPALRKHSLVQRDKIENPEGDPDLYGQLHFTNAGSQFSRKRIDFSKYGSEIIG